MSDFPGNYTDFREKKKTEKKPEKTKIKAESAKEISKKVKTEKLKYGRNLVAAKITKHATANVPMAPRKDMSLIIVTREFALAFSGVFRLNEYRNISPCIEPEIWVV